MEAQILHGLNMALDYWNMLDGKWYYVIGVVGAMVSMTPIVIQLAKHLHFKWTGVEMTNHFIDFVSWVTSFLMAAAAFVIAFGVNTQYLPQFLLVVVPTIKAMAPSVYTYSKAIHSWFVTRKSETQKQRLAATLKLANSFGTEANGVPVPATAETPTLPTRQQPEANLLQL